MSLAYTLYLIVSPTTTSELTELNNDENVLPPVKASLNCFTVPGALALYHHTHTESIPMLSVAVAVTDTGHAVFGVLPIGVVVTTGGVTSGVAVKV